jgi:hypothetical protein
MTTAPQAVQNVDGAYSFQTDGGLSQFVDTYFNGRNLPTTVHGPGRDNSRTHFILADQKAVMEDLGIVIRNLEDMNASWVTQPEFMGIRYSKKLESEITIIKFDKQVFPEQTPAESVSRTLNISKESMRYRSKRYGLGMMFEMDNMMTPEGQQEFGMFAAKISFVFAQHCCLLALSRLMQNDVSDLYYHNIHGTASLAARTAQVKKEVNDTFAAHKNPEGPLPMIWLNCQEMIRNNSEGGNPTHVLFNPEKQAMLKFFTKTVSDRETMMSADGVVEFQGLKFCPTPSFPSDMTDGGRQHSMLTRHVEIGNVYVYRNIMLAFPPKKVCVATQGYLLIHDENADGLKKKTLLEMNQHDLRWNANGELDANHKNVEGDMFTYQNAAGDFVPCRMIGDMLPKHVPDDLLRSMVGVFLRDVKMSTALRANLSGAEYNDGGLQPEDQHEKQILFRRMRNIFGGSRNILFRDLPSTASDDEVFKRIAQNCFGQSVEAAAGRRVFHIIGVNAAAEQVRVQAQTKTYQQVVDYILNYLDTTRPFAERVARVAVDGGTVAKIEEAIMEREAPTATDGLSDGMSIDGEHPQELSNDEYQELERLVRQLENGNFNGIELLKNKMEVYAQTLGAYSNAEDGNINLRRLDFAYIKRGLQLLNDTTLNGALFAAVRAALNLGNLDYDDDDDQATLAKGLFTALEQLIGCMQMAGSGAGKIQSILKANGYNDRFCQDANWPTDARGISKRIAEIGNMTFNQFFVDNVNVMNNKTAAKNGLMRVRVPMDKGKYGFLSVSSFGEYNEKGARFDDDNEVPNIGDHDSLRENIERVRNSTIFFDDVEKAVAYMILSTPINREVFNGMLMNDIFIPCEYVLARPWMKYRCSAAVLFQAANGGLGEVVVGYPNAAISWTTTDKTGELHVTQWICPVVKDYRRRLVMPCMFYEGRSGGANSDFFDLEAWEQFRNDDYSSNDETFPSIVVMSVPIRSYVRTDLFDIRGKLFDEETRPHYESAAFYGKKCGFDAFLGVNSTIYERMVNGAPNTVCFQGTQVPCGGIDGKPGLPVENAGHHGVERPGDKYMRETGLSVRDNMSAPLLVC